jgi:hypothetical protein
MQYEVRVHETWCVKRRGRHCMSNVYVFHVICTYEINSFSFQYDHRKRQKQQQLFPSQPSKYSYNSNLVAILPGPLWYNPVYSLQYNNWTMVWTTLRIGVRFAADALFSRQYLDPIGVPASLLTNPRIFRGNENAGVWSGPHTLISVLCKNDGRYTYSPSHVFKAWALMKHSLTFRNRASYI